MSGLQDADAAVDRVAKAIEDPNEESSAILIRQVNDDLAKMSEPERAYVQNTLAKDGLMPELSIETGLVSDNKFASREQLSEAGKGGNSTLESMAAEYLSENYATIAGNRHDIDSNYVEGFDLRLGFGIETARMMREFPGLLEALKKEHPNDSSIQSRDGLQEEDVRALLDHPERLSEDQKKALGFMSEYFDNLKEPRGLPSLFSSKTPRVTMNSLDAFVDGFLPMGFRPHLEMAKRDNSEQAELESGARSAADERNRPQTPDAVKPPILPQAPGDENPRQEVAPGKPQDRKPGQEVAPKPQDRKPGQEVAPKPQDRKPGDHHPDTVGPSIDLQDLTVVPPDAAPDTVGPNQNIMPPDSMRKSKSEVEYYNRFTDTEKQGVEKQDQGLRQGEDKSQLKSMKLQDSMTVEDFSRWQLGGNATTQDVENLSRRIIDANDSLQNASSVIEAGIEFRVPGDLAVRSPSADEKFIRIKQSMTVDAFARSQLAEGASEDDVRALTDKIVNANDGFSDGSSVIEADSPFKVPNDLELKELESDHKLIKLNQSMTVDAFARSQLEPGASDDQVRALSEKIVAANESLTDASSTIEAGTEFRVPGDLAVRAIEPDHKLMKLKQPMKVEDFARSQLAPGASDDDVRQLTDRIVAMNDDLADGASTIEAGKEVKIPKELELKPIETEYTVKPGDNLWKISKAYLREQNGGTRPSDAEVLAMVNKTVERNRIAVPDLIYPDQKLYLPGEKPEEIIPEPTSPEERRERGEMPEEVEPPEETTPAPEAESEERRLLREAAEARIEDPDLLSRFKTNMERFEQRAETDRLPREEVDSTYREIRRLLEFEGSTPTDAETREKIAQQVMGQAADPYSIDQGKHNTCNMNTVEVRTYKRVPSDAARLVADVATTGKYATRDGIELEIDATPHNASRKDQKDLLDGDRTHASEIFQTTAANIHLEQENRKTNPPGQLRFVQREGRPGTSDGGERVVDYSTTPPRDVVDHPQVFMNNLGKLGDVYESITGERQTEVILGHSSLVTDRAEDVKRVETEEELIDFLGAAKREGRFPITVAVHTANEPFWTDSGRGTAGGSGGGHVVNITDYQEGPPARITIDNSWGSDDDHDADNPVLVHDLYVTMHGPAGAARILKADVEAARAAGNPDFYQEFEMLRMTRKGDAIDDSQYHDQLKESMDRAKEYWEANPPDAQTRERAIKKLREMISLMPDALRTELSTYRTSLGL